MVVFDDNKKPKVYFKMILSYVYISNAFFFKLSQVTRIKGKCFPRPSGHTSAHSVLGIAYQTYSLLPFIADFIVD